eukprot:3518262-Rhodomonas_salina.2
MRLAILRPWLVRGAPVIQLQPRPAEYRASTEENGRGQKDATNNKNLNTSATTILQLLVPTVVVLVAVLAPVSQHPSEAPQC